MCANQANTPVLDHYLETKPAVFRYTLAVAAALAAVYLSSAIPVLHDKAVFLAPFFAVAGCAYWLGSTSGVLAFVLTALLINGLILLAGKTAVGMEEVVLLNAGFVLLCFIFIRLISANRKLRKDFQIEMQDFAHAQTIGNVGIWRFNISCDELIWSAQTYRIFGVPSHSKMNYEAFLACVHPDDREYVDRQWQGALKGEHYDIEHRIIAEGHERWVRERAHLEFGSGGELLGGFGTVQDITDRKMLLQNYLAARQDYESIVETAADAIISIDENQKIIFFNAAAEKMFACAAAGAIGTNLNRFIPERFRPAHAVLVDEFGRTGSSRHSSGKIREIKGLRADGEEFECEASISLTSAAHKKTFTVILRDLSDRRSAELAAKEKRQLQDQLMKIAASAPGIIVSFRLAPDGKASMPYASPAIEEVYGLAAEAVGQDASPIFDRIHPEDLAEVAKATEESAGTMQPWHQLFRYHHPAKGMRWLEGNSMPCREAGGGCLWHGYIQDVTDRKLAEEAIIDRDRQLRLIMDATPALISYLDSGLRYVRINQTYEDWFGLSPEQIIGHMAEEVVGPAAWRIVQPYLEQARAGEAVSFDYQIPYGNGPQRWAQVSYIPDKDADQQVRGIVVHVVDIEERVEAKLKINLLNEQLRHRLEELQAIFETAPVGLAITNDLEACHINGNPALEQMLGVPPGSELSKTGAMPANYNVLADGRPVSDAQLPMQRALRGETVQGQVLTILRGDGQTVSLISNAKPLKTEYGKARGAIGVFIDITKLIKTEQSLKRSQRQLLLLIQQAPVSIAMFDTRMNYLAASRLWLENFGLGLDNLTDLNYYEVLDELPRQWQEVHRRVLAGEFIKKDNDLWERADGSRMWLRWAAHPWTGYDGKIGGMIITSENITSQRMAEESVRVSEQFTRDVLNSLPEQIAVLDKHGTIIAVNEAWERFAKENALLNNARNLLAGTDYLEVCRCSAATGDIFAREALRGLQALQSGQKEEFVMEYPCITPYNERWFLMHARLMKNNPEGLIVAHLDITAMKLAQDALRESKAQLALIVAEINAAYWDFDIKRNILTVSPEWKRQLGIAGQERTENWQTLESRLHPDDRQFVMETTNNFIAGGQPLYELEYRVLHAGGSYRWLHSRGALLHDANGKPYRLLGMSLDITDFKKSRELNERRNEMEHSFRLYVAGQTAAAIAHELNQPLTAIAYFSDAAQSILDSATPNLEALAKIVQKCEQQAQRAGEVMRQLIDLLHKGEAASEPVNINEAINDACQIIKAEELDKGFDLAEQLAPGLAPVLGSHLLVQKVLINLVINSAEAMRECGLTEGTVIIRSEVCEEEPNMTMVSVQDEATTLIEEATLKKLFQPFYTTKENGLGMGLAISRSLIEAHGGNLWVKRNAERGLGIYFTLPFIS